LDKIVFGYACENQFSRHQIKCNPTLAHDHVIDLFKVEVGQT